MLIYMFNRGGVGTNLWVAAPSLAAAQARVIQHFEGDDIPLYGGVQSHEASMTNMLTRPDWIDLWVDA